MAIIPRCLPNIAFIPFIRCTLYRPTVSFIEHDGFNQLFLFYCDFVLSVDTLKSKLCLFSSNASNILQ